MFRIVPATMHQLINQAMFPNPFKRLSVPTCFKEARSAFLLTVIFVSVFLSCTFMRNGVWQNELMLGSDIVQKSPRKARANITMGTACQTAGFFDRALFYYATAAAREPDSAEAHNGLGLAYASQGAFDLAILHYRTALDLSPAYAKAHFNYGLICMNPAVRNIPQAREEFEAALHFDPEHQQARQFLSYIARHY